MALVFNDRVLETSTTTGTGAFTLAAAITGYQRFSAACSVADTCYYFIMAVDGNGNPSGDWETGLGTYSSADTLTRTTVHQSSNSDNAVSFAAGTKYVAISATAAYVGARAAKTQTTEMIAGFIASPSNKSYTLVLKAAHAGTITETTTICVSGTCTATFKIGSNALGGTANSVSSSEQSQAHASNNAVVAGDDIVLTISANSTCVDMAFSIKYTRTLD
jgi:hypothetical protein